MALLEAMSCGLPVAATAVDGVVRACAGTGLLVPRRDPDALGAALRDLCADADRRRALGDAALARVTEHYSPAALVAGYRALYAELDTVAPWTSGR